MKYLVRKKGQKQKAHLWTGGDTVCRMWSTGGLKQPQFDVVDTPGDHEICHMCKTLSERAA